MSMTQCHRNQTHTTDHNYIQKNTTFRQFHTIQSIRNTKSERKTKKIAHTRQIHQHIKPVKHVNPRERDIEV